MSRRPFIIASLDDAEKAYFNSWLNGGDAPLKFIQPTRFFKPAYHQHVDKYGFPDETVAAYDTAVKHLYGEWTDHVRKYPGSSYEYMMNNTLIMTQPITEAAYDGSNRKWQELDECTQWVQPWAFKKLDLNASIKKLLKMDVVFEEDYKKLLDWLKTRGKPVYLTGGEYHMLTNPRAYRHGLFTLHARHRRLSYEFINASFKTF